jgi:hypothetical protein
MMMSQLPPEQLFILLFRGSHLTQRESLDSEGVKLFEKKEETIPSPPSLVQREIVTDPVDPIAPVDVPKDIAVGHKRSAWARQTLQEVEGHATPRGTFKRARDHIDFRAMFQL